MLNPLAMSFEPGQSQAQHEQLDAASNLSGAVAQGDAPGHVAAKSARVSAAAAASQVKPNVIVGFAPSQEAPQSDANVAGGNGMEGGVIDERADKAVARRLLLKKRTPSFNKSKSCNDLVSVEPKSPTRSPFAPLANFAQ